MSAKVDIHSKFRKSAPAPARAKRRCASLPGDSLASSRPRLSRASRLSVDLMRI